MTARPPLASALVDEAAGLVSIVLDGRLLLLGIQDAVELARRLPGARCGTTKLGGSPGTRRVRIPALYFQRQTIRLARVVAGALPGERLRYRDGNNWNLTQQNLLIDPPRVAAEQVPADGPVTAGAAGAD